MESRERNLIMEIAPGAATRQLLASARSEWHESKPEADAHPLGEIHTFVWGLFLCSIGQACDKAASGVSADDIALIKDLIKDPDAMCRFFPLSKGGKVGPQEKPWLWQLRFTVASARGMEYHRRLLSAGKTVFKIANCEIREDRCPIRKLEKRINGGTLY